MCVRSADLLSGGCGMVHKYNSYEQTEHQGSAPVWRSKCLRLERLEEVDFESIPMALHNTSDSAQFLSALKPEVVDKTRQEKENTPTRRVVSRRLDSNTTDHESFDSALKAVAADDPGGARARARIVELEDALASASLEHARAAALSATAADASVAAATDTAAAERDVALARLEADAHARERRAVIPLEVGPRNPSSWRIFQPPCCGERERRQPVRMMKLRTAVSPHEGCAFHHYATC